MRSTSKVSKYAKKILSHPAVCNVSEANARVILLSTQATLEVVHGLSCLSLSRPSFSQSTHPAVRVSQTIGINVQTGKSMSATSFSG